jgi:hypothetical protein
MWVVPRPLGTWARCAASPSPSAARCGRFALALGSPSSLPGDRKDVRGPCGSSGCFHRPQPRRATAVRAPARPSPELARGRGSLPPENPRPPRSHVTERPVERKEPHGVCGSRSTRFAFITRDPTKIRAISCVARGRVAPPPDLRPLPTKKNRTARAVILVPGSLSSHTTPRRYSRSRAGGAPDSQRLASGVPP